MENYFFSSSPEEGDVPGCESSAARGLSKKQKKKQNKRENAAAAALLATTSRPGKKKLRKLRYQQQHVSSTDFLLLSTKACKFTQSVAETGLETTTIATGVTPVTTDNVDTKQSPTVLPVGSQVQVISSCMTPTNIDTFPRVTESSSFVPQRRIHVQPLLVLDLNGILCHRLRPHHHGNNIPRTAYRQVIAHVAGTPVVPRTDLVGLLTFLDQHFCLAVWTSAKNKTATALVQALIPSPIVQRLLFVWAQHHCDVIKEEAGEDNHESEPVFEKNLTKVWKEFPLWNAHTTILMDDSPEKCQRWHENSIHPPSLHGIKESELAAMGMQQLQSDEENARLQREFFEGLVQRLHEEFVVTQWTAVATVTPSCSSTEQNEKEETENEPYKVTSAPILLDHLRAKAVGHMGWT